MRGLARVPRLVSVSVKCNDSGTGIRPVPEMVHVSQQYDQAPCCLWQHSLTAMSASQPLLATIEADDPTEVPSGPLSSTQPKTARPAVVLTPTTISRSHDASSQMANTVGDAESGECQRSYLERFKLLNAVVHQELAPSSAKYAALPSRFAFQH